jgi:uncharacterized protein YjbI with pentapeptide repeats
MTIDTHSNTGKGDRPLTREDVERLLTQAGNSEKLNLSNRNLFKADLSGLNLRGANLRGANLRGANLRGANLRGANLRGANPRGANPNRPDLREAKLGGVYLDEANLRRANPNRPDLREANLSYANLSYADLHGANLSYAKLSGANLHQAELSGANLSYAKLSGANLHQAELREANLSYANLSYADLSGANLRYAKLSYADLSYADLSYADLSYAGLSEANLHGAELSEANLLLADLHQAEVDISISELISRGAIIENPASYTGSFRFRIIEDPLTASNLSLTLSALSELHTKFWLTAQGRFEDLINFTTTHNPDLARETALIIGKLSHNSPAEIDLKLDASPKGVAEALEKMLDTLYQAKSRKKKLDLENQKLAEEITRQQKLLESELADKDQDRRIKEQNALLELQERQFKLRQEIIQAQLKVMNEALDTAKKMVEILYPDADAASRGVYAQTYVKNILELNEVTGLEALFQLPAPKTGSSNPPNPPSKEE